jgi:hypothetical protein
MDATLAFMALASTTISVAARAIQLLDNVDKHLNSKLRTLNLKFEVQALVQILDGISRILQARESDEQLIKIVSIDVIKSCLDTVSQIENDLRKLDEFAKGGNKIKLLLLPTRPEWTRLDMLRIELDRKKSLLSVALSAMQRYLPTYLPT